MTMTVNLPERVRIRLADPERLSQLFDNVLENSKRYTDPGGQVKIGLECGQE